MVSLLDNRIEVATPEGVNIELTPAGPIVRIAAFAIDCLIRMAILLAVSITFSSAGNFGSGIVLISYFFIEWFYPVCFELLRNGQTPGKRAMSITVVLEDATPIRFSNSLIRNLLRVVDFLPVGYLFGIVATVVNPRFQRIGDLFAQTLVIYVPQKSSMNCRTMSFHLCNPRFCSPKKSNKPSSNLAYEPIHSHLNAGKN